MTTNEVKADIFEVFDGWKPGDWVWCLHCERCYQAGEFRIVKGEYWGAPRPQMCPYENCDGDTIFDSRHWEVIAEVNNYPPIPERNKFYPMYPEE